MPYTMKNPQDLDWIVPGHRMPDLDLYFHPERLLNDIRNLDFGKIMTILRDHFEPFFGAKKGGFLGVFKDVLELVRKCLGAIV